MLWFKCNEILPGAGLAVFFVGFCLSIYLGCQEISFFLDVDDLCRMAEAPDDKMEAFKQTGQSAFILGYSGETGRRLAKQLAREKMFERVTLIGRRRIDLSNEGIGPEFEQAVVDFENLDEHADAFFGHDVGFCCIGTTRAKAGVEGFKRVDHDYVLKSAELAKAGGTSHFLFMSTYGANHNSTALYTSTKGQVEEALKTMHFERLSIFRPAVLMVDRQETRPIEAFAQMLLRPVSAIFPTAITIPIDTMVRAFINNVITSSDKHAQTFENKEIHIMAGTSRHCSDKQNSEL